jgi:hypothetical protein
MLLHYPALLAGYGSAGAQPERPGDPVTEFTIRPRGGLGCHGVLLWDGVSGTGPMR